MNVGGSLLATQFLSHHAIQQPETQVACKQPPTGFLFIQPVHPELVEEQPAQHYLKTLTVAQIP